MRPRDPFTVGLVLVLYVVPLGAAAVLLALAGLPLVALALLVVEVVVAAAVVLAKRPARAPGATRDRPPSAGVVALGVVGVLAALVGLAVLGSRLG